jgi:hypothetical protein
VSPEVWYEGAAPFDLYPPNRTVKSLRALLSKRTTVSGIRMLRVFAFAAAAFLALAPAAHASCPNPVTPPTNQVTHIVKTVLGLQVDHYAWYDSQCLKRTVSIKQEGGGNPGHGGYAVQMTYQIATVSGPSTIVVNQETTGDGGFGYFVSHERYRMFTDGSSDTIADKIFHVDDSPLGLDFAAPGANLPQTATAAAFRINTTYHHYGTVTPDPVDAAGDDTTNLPLTAASYARYKLPVTLTWVFQAQTDAPRYDVDVDLTQVGEADRVGFDLRAPYGVMVFDNGQDGVMSKAQWGDRFLFATTSAPVIRNSGWNWITPNPGGRFNAMIAGGYEMGLYEPVPFAQSRLADGYAQERGSTSIAFNKGKGCVKGEKQILPCDWAWPYQGLQYSLPTNSRTTPTNFKKIAWGSTAFYGAGVGLPRVFDSSSSSEPIVGFPTSQHIDYSVCILLGLTVPKGLTRAAAPAVKPNCASAVFN